MALASMGDLLNDILVRLGIVERRLRNAGGSSRAAGLIQPFGGTVPPTGWLICNGAEVLRADYPALFQVIGTTWGAGNGTTTFNLPDFRGASLFGHDPSQTEFDTIGEGGGAKTHRHDFRFGLFDRGWSAAGSFAAMESTAQANDLDRMGAYRYSTGKYQGASNPGLSASSLSNNSAIAGGTAVSAQLNREVTTGDTDVPAGTTGLPPFKVVNYIISLGSTSMSGGGDPPVTDYLRSGSTAARDALFGIPSTDAEKVALANQRVQWYNSTKGYAEVYYATTGLTGLTVTGLLAGHTSGWYPVAGTLMTCTRIAQNGFQAVGAAVTAAPNLLWPALVNVGGFTQSGTNGIIVPVGGYYDAVGAVYWSGGGANNYANAHLQDNASVAIAGQQGYYSGADAWYTATALGFPIVAGQLVKLVGSHGGGSNIYGDGIRRLTHLSVEYKGPPLAS